MAPLDKHNFWYSFGIFSPHAYTWLPNTMLIITLISNFGTFLLYMTTCIVAIVAFRSITPSTGSSTWWSRCSVCWPTSAACCSTWSARFRSPAGQDGGCQVR
jgi:hypothetical protein